MRALTALPTLVQTKSYAPMRSSSSIIQKKKKSAKYGRMHYSKLKVFRLIGRNKIHDGREGGVCVFNDGKGKASNSYANPGTCRVELGIHWG